MLDIQPIWLLVLAVNFLVLMLVLNAILFKPLMQIFKQREDTVKGDLDGARDMATKREDSIAKLNRELADSRTKAKDVFETIRGEGVLKQKEAVSAAEAEAVSMIEKARAEIKADAEKARAGLKADIDKFSDEIVRKLVKV
ncbi:MAG TPA: ATP synthase F0 subunit B [Thermodesulfovibrionales bacterium]|nr:ATP synthase F0 subunit B [Thermodesulfovibrionales bacterium]